MIIAEPEGMHCVTKLNQGFKDFDEPSSQPNEVNS